MRFALSVAGAFCMGLIVGHLLQPTASAPRTMPAPRPGRRRLQTAASTVGGVSVAGRPWYVAGQHHGFLARFGMN